jgi:hypothetical protein
MVSNNLQYLLLTLLVAASQSLSIYLDLCECSHPTVQANVLEGLSDLIKDGLLKIL